MIPEEIRQILENIDKSVEHISIDEYKMRNIHEDIEKKKGKTEKINDMMRNFSRKKNGESQNNSDKTQINLKVHFLFALYKKKKSQCLF